MGLDSIIQSVLGSFLGTSSTSSTSSTSTGHRDYLDVAQGDSNYNTETKVLTLITTTAHSDYYKIWEYSVPAQQQAAWGYGSAGLPRNQGFMWFAAMAEGTGFDVGFLRIQQSDANGYKPKVVATIPDSALHGTTITSTEAAHPSLEDMIPLPEKREYPVVGEDSKLQLFYALRTPVASHDAVAFDIPITRYIL